MISAKKANERMEAINAERNKEPDYNKLLNKVDFWINFNIRKGNNYCYIPQSFVAQWFEEQNKNYNYDYLLKLTEKIKDYGYEIKIDTWSGIIIYW